MNLKMSVLSVLLFCVMSVAGLQQPSLLHSLIEKANAESISVDYEFATTISGFKTVGEGVIQIQGNSYHMVGNGMEIYCDGASTWVIDEAAMEVMIESAASADAGFLANPVMLLMNIEENALSYKAEGDKIFIQLDPETMLEITIRSITSEAIKKPEAFRPPVEFGSDWIVTDMR